jgi:hypothetical protein
MSTFEELENMWEKNQITIFHSQGYDHTDFEKIVRSRTKKHTNTAMQYFWASFVLQIVVYALFGHVIVKYGGDIETLLLSAAGILLFLPFTIMLMAKYKRMAVTRPEDGNSVTSLFNYVMTRYSLLQTFYKFKRRYEFLLIPLSSLIGVFLVFKLYVPGGVEKNLTGAAITFMITLICCIQAIRSENKKNFEKPLHHFRELLEEFKMER